MNSIRAGKRSFKQKFITDPAIGITVILFWGMFKLMPVDMASFCGVGIGWILSKIARKKNKTALHNLRKCFPEKTDKEHRKILKGMWSHWGRNIGEMPKMKKMFKRITFKNAHYFEEMRDDGKGGFVCSAHLGNWEISGLVAGYYNMPIHSVYRVANNPWIEKFVYQRRKLAGDLIPKGPSGARKMIELLKKGDHIAMLCDQKLREGIWVPFFGHPAQTPQAIATLALKMEVPIYMSQAYRTKGARYTCVAYPPLDVEKTGNKEQDTYEIMYAINKTYEEWIRAHPEQWLWIHHRWPKEEYKND